MDIAENIKDHVSDIEAHTTLTSDEKVWRIKHIACSTCAAVGAQPIPFADIFLLVSVQAYFAGRIAGIRGVPVSESDAMEYIKGISGMVGLGIVVEQFSIGVLKILTFGFGGMFTVVVDYAMTYAVMMVSDAYFSAKANGETLTRAQARIIWKSALREGKKKGITEKRKIETRKQH